MPASKSNAESVQDPSIPTSYEAAVAELETLVGRMDEPEMGLETLLRDYRRGAFLVKFCRDKLTQVKQEISAIDQDLDGLTGEAH